MSTDQPSLRFPDDFRVATDQQLDRFLSHCCSTITDVDVEEMKPLRNVIEEIRRRRKNDASRDALWREYVALIGEESRGLVGLATVHGWKGASDEVVRRGREMREELGIEDNAQDRPGKPSTEESSVDEVSKPETPCATTPQFKPWNHRPDHEDFCTRLGPDENSLGQLCQTHSLCEHNKRLLFPNSTRLHAFIYVLLRDHILFGVLERVVHELEDPSATGFTFASHHMSSVAGDVLARLLVHAPPPEGVPCAEVKEL